MSRHSEMISACLFVCLLEVGQVLRALACQRNPHREPQLEARNKNPPRDPLHHSHPQGPVFHAVTMTDRRLLNPKYLATLPVKGNIHYRARHALSQARFDPCLDPCPEQGVRTRLKHTLEHPSCYPRKEKGSVYANSQLC